MPGSRVCLSSPPLVLWSIPQQAIRPSVLNICCYSVQASGLEASYPLANGTIPITFKGLASLSFFPIFGHTRQRAGF